MQERGILCWEHDHLGEQVFRDGMALLDWLFEEAYALDIEADNGHMHIPTETHLAIHFLA